MVRKEVIIKKRMTNKLKQQLKKLDKEHEIKLKIVNKLHDMFDKLDLLEYTDTEHKWDYINKCNIRRKVRRWYPLGEVLRRKVDHEYKDTRDRLMCIKQNRIHRYGRKNGNWKEDTDKVKVRTNRRQVAKIRQIMRIHEQALQAKN